VIGVDREREKIGEGAFAKVYVGVHHGKQVAVKVFKENAITIDSEQPKKEFEMLISLKHPNIVRLYGMWRDPHKGRNVLAIVMELCNCSLGKYIREHFGQRGISREKKLQILRGITNAMIYLHGQNVLHRHLNSSNVLVNQIQNRKDCDSITAKLTDVDIAQVLDPQSQVLYADLIYEASLPPEVLHGHEHKGKMKNLARLTAQVDVFCFGPIAIELACGEFPIPTAKVETRKGEVVQTYSEIERRNKYLMKIKPADRMFTDLIVEQCMADQPEERGSFLDLQVIIECFQRKYEKRSDKELLEEKQFEMEELRAQMEVDQREWEHERGGLRIQLVSIKESESSLKNHLAEVQEEMEATKVQQRELENERGELRTQLTSAKENESSLKTQLTEMQEELVATKDKRSVRMRPKRGITDLMLIVINSNGAKSITL
jgi:serine/threonine protein kinase